MVKNLKLILSLGQFNVQKGKHILLLLLLPFLLLKVARKMSLVRAETESMSPWVAVYLAQQKHRGIYLPVI